MPKQHKKTLFALVPILFSRTMSDSEEEFSFFNEDDLPQRTSSAPPILEVQEGSLFAAGNSYAHFFAERQDIRTDDDYLQFYETFNDTTRKLPPPLSSFDLHEDLEVQWIACETSQFVLIRIYLFIFTNSTCLLPTVLGFQKPFCLITMMATPRGGPGPCLRE